ncbi:MAG: metal-dependent hydrolase [Anaerolineae bacterium]|nr:metal-dependent hydrolase [Anaerolineae bacterium]
MAIQIKWLGHAGFQLDIGNHTVLIDPFLTGNPLAAVPAASLSADFILLSHGHGDHVNDTPAIARRTGATVVANFEVGSWMREKQGLENVHTLNPGGGVALPFGRVELTIAHHSSSLPDGSYGGQPNGILIFTDEGPVLYHAGDTTVFYEMQLIGAHGIDLAMLPIGDYFTMGIEGSLQAIKFIQPRAVIPMHYNTFPPIMQDVSEWAQRVQNETEAQPIVLDPGGIHQL